jgi:hypothetical protein
MESLEVIAIRQRQKGIVQVDLWDPGSAQNNVLHAGLSVCSHLRYRHRSPASSN